MRQKELMRMADFVERDGYNGHIWQKVEEWQKANNCSGIPSASSIGLKVIGHSVGTYGRNGVLVLDLEDGYTYGIPGRGYWVYLD